MKLIVGLGNIGKQYTNTRHNLGFLVLDKLVEQQSWPSFQSAPKFKALISQATEPLGEDKLIVVKPATMMNLSGQAVGELARFYKIEPTDIWVIHDEVDIEFGQMRIKLGGGSAGHNGIKSITEAIGPDFGRFRIGIYNQLKDPTPTDQFVLDRFTPEEQNTLPSVVINAAGIICDQLDKSNLEIQTYNLLENNNLTK